MLFDSLCEERGCEHSGVLGSGLVSVSFLHAARGVCTLAPTLRRDKHQEGSLRCFSSCPVPLSPSTHPLLVAGKKKTQTTTPPPPKSSPFSRLSFFTEPFLRCYFPLQLIFVSRVATNSPCKIRYLFRTLVLLSTNPISLSRCLFLSPGWSFLSRGSSLPSLPTPDSGRKAEGGFPLPGAARSCAVPRRGTRQGRGRSALRRRGAPQGARSKAGRKAGAWESPVLPLFSGWR